MKWYTPPNPFPPAPPVPSYNDADLMNQWREASQAGNGEEFGDPAWGSHDISEACEISQARFICELDTPNCYLVEWWDNYHVVCDCNGWWACPVNL